jgi:hypothetical protein
MADWLTLSVSAQQPDSGIQVACSADVHGRGGRDPLGRKLIHFDGRIFALEVAADAFIEE